MFPKGGLRAPFGMKAKVTPTLVLPATRSNLDILTQLKIGATPVPPDGAEVTLGGAEAEVARVRAWEKKLKRLNVQNSAGLR